MTVSKHNLINARSTYNFCSFQGSSFVSPLPVVWIEQKPPLQVKPHIPVKPWHMVRSCSEASRLFMPLQTYMTFSHEIKNKMLKIVFPTQWRCMLIWSLYCQNKTKPNKNKTNQNQAQQNNETKQSKERQGKTMKQSNKIVKQSKSRQNNKTNKSKTKKAKQNNERQNNETK